MKNEDFGFSCVHYSVSEASKSLKVMIENKKKESGRVRVCTVDAEAKATKSDGSPGDYDRVDTVIVFKKGEGH